MARRDPDTVAACQAAADAQAALDRATTRIRELERAVELVNSRLVNSNEERDQFRAACYQLDARLASAMGTINSSSVEQPGARRGILGRVGDGFR